MIRKKYRFVILFGLLILFSVFISSFSVPQKIVYTENGLLDLSGQDFSKRENFKLDGEWEFYWRQFLSYDDFRDTKPDMYADVPNMWTNYQMNGERLPGEGYATYRLHVITDLDTDTKFGLRINTFSSAYKLYINESLVVQAGEISSEASGEIGKYTPQAAYFQAPAREFDVIIQVSNFAYAKGGFWESIYMGTAENIRAFNTYTISKELFLIGVLIIASVFHLGIYLLKTELKSYLYLSCFCLLMSVMVDTVGEGTLIGAIPQLSVKTAVFLRYTSTTWAPFFLLLFLHKLFKTRFSTIAVKIYLSITTVLQLIFILFPLNEYTKLGFIGDLHDLAGYACAFLAVAIGVKKGYKDGWLQLVGMLAVLLCYIYDSLDFRHVINVPFGETLYAGLFFFIFLQMIAQAHQHKLLIDKEAAMEMAFLQAQIKPHFLYNAMNTFIAVSYDDVGKTRNLMLDFGNYMRRSFDFKDLSQFVSLRDEIELSRCYVNIEKARFEERLEVNFDICEGTQEKVPCLTLEPIIENAINHGILPKEEGGRVDVVVKKDGKSLFFSVSDNGVGIDAQKLKNILKRESTEGIGLYNIDSRLRKIYGTGLHISSSPGKGTEVTWTIPINRKAVHKRHVTDNAC